MIMPSFIPNYSPSASILVSSLDDDSEDGNLSFPTQLPPLGFVEHEHISTPNLPIWFCTTQEASGDFVSDSSNQHCTCS